MHLAPFIFYCSTYIKLCHFSTCCKASFSWVEGLGLMCNIASSPHSIVMLPPQDINFVIPQILQVHFS